MMMIAEHYFEKQICCERKMEKGSRKKIIRNGRKDSALGLLLASYQMSVDVQ